MLGSVTTAPFSYVWSGVAAGSYNLTARATDNSGATTTSAAVDVTVIAVPRINVALAANGGVATASSAGTLNLPAKVNDGFRTITNGYWRDATYNSWPDWVQIKFNSLKTISGINVITAPDNLASAIEPVAGLTTFTTNGITAYDVQSWNGTAWVTVPGGNITGNNLVWRTISFPAVTTDRIRVVVNASLANNSRIVEIEAYADGAIPVNIPPVVSLTTPSTGTSYTAPATITLTAAATDSDGTISKVEFYNGASLLGSVASAPFTYIWSGVSAGSYTLTARATDNSGATTTSAAVTVSVSAPVNIPPVVALTTPSTGASYTAPATITLTAAATDSDGTISKVEFYNGASLLGSSTTAPYSYVWSGVSAGSYTLTARATDNSGATTTSAGVDVTVTAVARINVALATNGAVATASSAGTLNPAARVNDGLRTIANGYWRDATYNSWPDWVQIKFNSQKTLSEIDVITAPDNLASTSEPVAGLTTFTTNGITAYDVQYWSGAAWVTLPGGSITGNNLVWRTISFPAVTTDRIRVVVNASLANNSRIVEIEAYEIPSGNLPPVTPTLSWPTPANITAGVALSALQLNATASVPGTFTYTPPAGTILSVGTHTLSVIFGPTDSITYSTASATVSLVVNPAPLSITTPVLASGTVGTPYSQTVAASGGISPYVWSVSAGTLPDGLTLSASGIITGTPTSAGIFNFTARVTDIPGTLFEKALSIQINAAAPLAIMSNQAGNPACNGTWKASSCWLPAVVPSALDSWTIRSGDSILIDDQRTIGTGTIGTTVIGQIATLSISGTGKVALSGNLNLASGNNQRSTLRLEAGANLDLGTFNLVLGTDYSQSSGYWRFETAGTSSCPF